MFEELSLVSTIPFGIALFNWATWRRPEQATHATTASVSVLIPARNEAERIEKAILGALRSKTAAGEPVAREVLVYDDDSTDGTADLTLELARSDARVRLLRGGPLPPGWVGKPHACQRLSEEAKGDTLVFMDADVELEPLGLARLVSVLEPGIDAVSAVPRQVTGSAAERAIIPLLLLTYLAWLPLDWVETRRSSRFVAANGQLIMLRSASLEALGGFRAIRAAIVDDVALLRRAKEQGQKVRFVDGMHVASCRMYDSAAGLWRGFSKNLAPGLGGSFWTVFAAVSLYLVCFVVPYITLGFGLIQGDLRTSIFGGIGVAWNVLLRILLSVRYRQGWAQIFLHPLSVLLLVVIAWNSWLWVRRRRIVWAGRTYAETQG